MAEKRQVGGVSSDCTAALYDNGSAVYDCLRQLGAPVESVFAFSLD
jgi:hypothetical protein